MNMQEGKLRWLQPGILRRGLLELSFEGLVEVSHVNKSGESVFQGEGHVFKGTEVGELFKECRQLYSCRERLEER